MKSMKSTLTILLIFSFMGIAVFGALAMNNSPSYCYSLCIGAIKSLSTAVLSLLIVLITIANAAAASPVFVKTISRKRIIESYPYQLKFTHWLAIHENSPAIP